MYVPQTKLLKMVKRMIFPVYESRDLILIGDGLNLDDELFPRGFGVDLDFESRVKTVIDTRSLGLNVYKDQGLKTIDEEDLRLKKLVTKFGIHDSDLRNPGNDAAFTIRTLFHLAIKDVPDLDSMQRWRLQVYSWMVSTQ